MKKEKEDNERKQRMRDLVDSIRTTNRAWNEALLNVIRAMS